MPINRTAFVRTSALLLIVGMIALTAIIGSTLWLVQRADSYFDDVIRARDLRAATVDLRALVQDMVTGQRGFLLTGNDSYLEPYQIARGEVMGAYGRMQDAISLLPAVADEPMRRLHATLEEKTQEIDLTIDLATQGRQVEALAIVQTDRGEEIMDEARTFLDQVTAAADAWLMQSAANQRQAAAYMRLVTLLGGLVILLVVGGSVWMALSYTRELLAARVELEAMNEGLEERVEERTQELIRANEEVQRFAYVVTHDLRAPLVNIMGFTSELDETMKEIQAYVLADGDALSAQEIQSARTAASEDLPEAIGFIRSSTKKMDGLINAILKISRDGRRTLKPETVDLDAMLEASAAAVQHQLVEADGDIELDIGVARLVTDRMSLEQALSNLIDNAIKYRAPDRPLRIKVSARPMFGNRVKIDVADNGRGIAEADRQRVFDLFRRAGPQDQAGEGIGLAHVRSLMRNMGGDIVLASEPDRGTVFTITLPADLTSLKRSM